MLKVTRTFKALHHLTLLWVSCAVVTLFTTMAFAADPPFNLPPPAEISKLRSAILELQEGDVFFELYPDQAPWHVANLKYLADKGVFRNSAIHFVRPSELIQGGLPDKQWRAELNYSIPAEFSEIKHLAGTLGMGRIPDEANRQRRSSSSQFHILLQDNPRMDGNYTAFGRAIAGMEILERIRQGDRIRDFKVFVQQSGR